MKIFALYADIALTKKPDWLDGFVAKNNPWGLHVTIKQACYLEDDRVPSIKEKLSQFFKGRTTLPIAMAFDKVECGRSEDDPIIVLAEKNEEIKMLQGDLCNLLSEVSNYVDPATENYEKNFRPHITISYGIPESEYQECLDIVKDGCKCEGVINEIVLSVLGSVTVEEAHNPANKTIYRLTPS
ncbi:2'-5' RNA ligase family protein [Candidatus Uhrbacteria bacterium]|nr:2'-5' RNA ligase family protein [Candidatus Uhrbacteria bacterium]